MCNEINSLPIVTLRLSLNVCEIVMMAWYTIWTHVLWRECFRITKKINQYVNPSFSQPFKCVFEEYTACNKLFDMDNTLLCGWRFAFSEDITRYVVKKHYIQTFYDELLYDILLNICPQYWYSSSIDHEQMSV